MWKFKDNTLDHLFKFRENLSCAVVGSPGVGTTSFIVDITSKILKNNKETKLQYVSFQNLGTDIINYYYKSLVGVPMELANQEHSLSFKNFIKDRWWIDNQDSIGVNRVTEYDRYIEDKFFDWLENSHAERKFNILVLDYPQSVISLRIHLEDFLIRLDRWSKENGVFLLFIWKAKSARSGDGLPRYAFRHINSVIQLEKKDQEHKMIIIKNPVLIGAGFMLKTDIKNNNYFLDIHMGESRKIVFGKSYKLKGKEYINDFLIKDEDRISLDWDSFYKKAFHYKSPKLKKEITEKTFIDNIFLDMDPINIYELTLNIYNNVDENFYRDFLNKKDSYNKIPTFIKNSTLLYCAMGHLISRLNIKQKTWLNIVSISNTEDLEYLFAISDTILNIIEKEQEYNVDFFLNKIKNSEKDDANKIINIIKKASTKMHDFLYAIKKQEFSKNQAKINFLNNISWRKYSLVVIDSVEELFKVGDELSNCLGSDRYVMKVVNDNDYIIVLKEKDKFAGAIHFDKDFYIVEMKKAYNKNFSEEMIFEMQIFLKGFLKDEK